MSIENKWKECEFCLGEEGDTVDGVWKDCAMCEGQGGEMTIVNSDCGHECFIIGGRFIAEDPECSVHGINQVGDSQ